LDNSDLKKLISLLEERNQLLLERERDLEDRGEELTSQKEELTAAIEEVIQKNYYLNDALQRLQQRNQELDEILYRASHDLRSPVSSIVGLLDLLQSGGLTSAQQTIYQHLMQKTAQMTGLLNSLSTLSQAAFDTIRAQPIDLHRLGKNVLDSLKGHSNFNSTTFNLSFENSGQCYADELKLTIILKCLVENALTFRDGSKPGHISVSTCRNGDHLSMEVIDDGEGIAEEIKDKIFNMFYRGSERSLGAGLGLYIVKSIVDRLDGELLLDAKQGNTSFKVLLPGCYELR
jgi:signal transduction histidine kinase